MVVERCHAKDDDYLPTPFPLIGTVVVLPQVLVSVAGAKLLLVVCFKTISCGSCPIHRSLSFTTSLVDCRHQENLHLYTQHVLILFI